MQKFLPFLPDAGAHTEAAAATLEDVEWLLHADAAEFWLVSRSDASLAQLVDTYLRHAARPYDDGFRHLGGVELALWRHMLALLHRMFAEKGPGTPPHRDRAALLARITTVPALLDACSLYAAVAAGGGEQRSHLPEVAAAMLALQPRLRADLASTGDAIANNALQVVDACTTAARAAPRNPAMLESLADGVDYLRDSCLTLCALLCTLPPAAAALLQHGPTLIEALGAVHDQLLPVAEAAAGAGATAAHALLRRRCLHVEVACEKAVQLLLVHGYLEAAAAGGGGGGGGPGPGSRGRLEASGATSSSSGGGSSAAATARGEALLEAVMLLGHREGEAAGGAAAALGGGLSLAPALAQRHGLAASIQAALRAGAVALDDAQADYLCALMGVASLGTAPALVPEAPAGTSAAGAGSSSAGGAVPLSLVAQVRDLLPDFGEGYVAACLQVLGRGVESTVNVLLEGAAPPGLEHLDRNLPYQQYLQQYGPAAAAGAGGEERSGERAAAAPASTPAARFSGAGFPALGFSGAGFPELGGAAGSGRPFRRPDNKTALYLDAREDGYRGAVAAAAAEAQWEYDDEYDDSFDELLHIGADGLCEAEGDEEAEAGGAGAGAALAGAGPAGRLDQGMRGLSLQPGAAPFQPGGRGRGGGGRGGRPLGKGSRLWVLDGKIYNYAKPGAAEVGSAEEAEARVREGQQATMQIHGLGPGGNRPQQAQQAQQAQQPEQAQQPQQPQQPQVARLQGDVGRGGEQEGGRGSGRGGGSAGGRGRGRSDADSRRWKDAHKSAVGNHHRKDRAAQKQARGMQ